jgi:tetrahydromethanopterin S-methyltransferase subunit G
VEFANKLASAGVKVWTYATADRTHDSINDDVGTLYDPVTGMIILFLEKTLPTTHLGQVVWK